MSSDQLRELNQHIGHRMYRGEYYYMQSDAHVTFTQNWDEDIISQQEATKNEMAVRKMEKKHISELYSTNSLIHVPLSKVLSTYLTDIVGSINKNGDSLRDTRPIMCNTDYEEGQNNRYLRHGSQPEANPSIRERMNCAIASCNSN